MNKAWLYSSLLGVATLGVAAATFSHHDARFQFLSGAEQLKSNDVLVKKTRSAHVELYNLHVPYEQAWDAARAELCDKDGAVLEQGSTSCQGFTLPGNTSVMLARGKVDAHEDFIEGTESTDTYVVVRTFRG